MIWSLLGNVSAQSEETKQSNLRCAIVRCWNAVCGGLVRFMGLVELIFAASMHPQHQECLLGLAYQECFLDLAYQCVKSSQAPTEKQE